MLVGKVKSVSGTQIFAIPNRTGDRQLTVYANKVDSLADNMMILPVPNPSTVRFEQDVMAYSGLFKDCCASFQVWTPESNTLSAHSTRGVADPLPVMDIGSYQVSLAHSIADLNRLDTSIFSLRGELFTMLRQHYPPTMGFVCCRLRPGATTYEPIAYSHALLRKNILFIPTRHFHDEADALPHYNRFLGATVPKAVTDIYSTFAEDWDHEIFTALTAYPEAHTEGAWRPRSENRLDWSQIPAEFNLGSATTLFRWEKEGRWWNKDLEFSLVTTVTG